MSQDWKRLAELERHAHDILGWTNVQIAQASAEDITKALDAHNKALQQQPQIQPEYEDIPEKVVDLSARFPNAPKVDGRSIAIHNGLLDMLIACYELVSSKTVDSNSIFDK